MQQGDHNPRFSALHGDGANRGGFGHRRGAVRHRIFDAVLLGFVIHLAFNQHMKYHQK